MTIPHPNTSWSEMDDHWGDRLTSRQCWMSCHPLIHYLRIETEPCATLRLTGQALGGFLNSLKPCRSADNLALAKLPVFYFIFSIMHYLKKKPISDTGNRHTYYITHMCFLVHLLLVQCPYSLAISAWRLNWSYVRASQTITVKLMHKPIACPSANVCLLNLVMLICNQHHMQHSPRKENKGATAGCLT